MRVSEPKWPIRPWSGKWVVEAGILLAVAASIQIACTSPQKPAATRQTLEPARITQFYATVTQLPRGEKALLCYGVENAKSVSLSPPRQELSASLARCVEVTPSVDTTYTLTAEGAGGQSATQQLTVMVTPPLAKIINVDVSAIEIKRGETLSICYQVQNARMVRIDPVRFQATTPKGCTHVVPMRTTTYVVSAIGAEGDRDQERVTVKVQ
jgi:hypothetical protein